MKGSIEWREDSGHSVLGLVNALLLLSPTACVRRGHCCVSQEAAPSPVAGLPGPPGHLVITPVALE